MSKKKSKTKNIKVENSTETLSLSSKCNIEGVFDDDTETGNYFFFLIIIFTNRD